jgi:hypothetical protein
MQTLQTQKTLFYQNQNQKQMTQFKYKLIENLKTSNSAKSKDGHAISFSISLKGGKRKNNAHDVYLSNTIKKYGLKWKYVNFAITEVGNLIFFEGNSSAGYLISQNNISNANLVVTVFNHFNIPTPKEPGELKRILCNVDQFYSDAEKMHFYKVSLFKDNFKLI